MLQWPIRIKLYVGLSVVIAMMLTLMGASIYGLRAFHSSNLTLVDQLPELGASKDLLQSVVRLEALRNDSLDQRWQLETQVESARKALAIYADLLKKNSMRGNRADDGRDELGLAFLIDHDLTAVLHEMSPEAPIGSILPGTDVYLSRHPEALDGLPLEPGLAGRINRLNRLAVQLPDKLHRDVFAVLELSKRQYHSSRLIVWTSALIGLAMIVGLTMLFHRWVLYPVRLLHRGVRRVARGSFDYKIELKTGDEMQGWPRRSTT
jgi:HAMP domain-containing protein